MIVEKGIMERDCREARGVAFCASPMAVALTTKEIRGADDSVESCN
jgi:hypothetical protein